MPAERGRPETTEVVFQGDLKVAYLDPKLAPSIRAYVPEVHASPRCHRALPNGRRQQKLPDDRSDLPWCFVCTTDDPELATIRLVNGRWEAVAGR